VAPLVILLAVVKMKQFGKINTKLTKYSQ